MVPLVSRRCADRYALSNNMSRLADNVVKARRLMAGHGRYAVLLVFVMLAAALAESLGLSLVLPLISTLANIPPTPGTLTEITNRLLSILPYDGLEALLGLLVFAFIVKGALLVVARGLTIHFVLRLREHWASRIFAHYLHAKPPYLAQKRLGKLIQNTTTESHEAAQGVIRALGLINRLILTVVLLAVLLLAHWQATLIVGAIGLGMIFIAHAAVSGRVLDISRRRLDYRQQITSVVAESLTGVRQVKLFHQYGPVEGRLKDKLHRFTNTETLLQVVSEIPTQITEISIIALLAGVLLVMKYVFNIALDETIALLGFFVVVAQRLMGYLSFIVRQRVKFASHLPSLALMDNLMQNAPAREDILIGDELKSLSGTIEFRNVGFRYDDDTVLFENLNLEIPRNSTVAIVGSSGAGKSTIADLLLGFERPKQGTILIDGRDLNEFSLKSLRRHIGYVTQESELFNVSVRDNITLGRMTASDQEITAAAKLARAHDFIEALPDGYDTVIGERGSKLSGGQRQRLALARVFLRQPDLYILDEATSSLDAESEALVGDSLLQIKGTATFVIIAHRQSTIDAADIVYRIDEDGAVSRADMTEDASVTV